MDVVHPRCAGIDIGSRKNLLQTARWIQKLHSRGLLTGGFLPDETTETLRTYSRQRSNRIAQSAEATHKMQKYLRPLTFRLDVVVKDVCGLTGMAIIAGICKGNLNAVELAKHRHFNCRKSEEEIAKALKGNNRKDYLSGLKQEFESYQFCQKKITECDVQSNKFLKEQINTDPSKKTFNHSKNPQAAKQKCSQRHWP